MSSSNLAESDAAASDNNTSKSLTSNLLPLLDQLSQYALDLSQNKIFTTSLCEYIQSASQQLFIYDKLLQTNPDNPYIATMNYSDVQRVSDAIAEACTYLMEVLGKDPQFSRKEDAQNDYMFEREDREQVGMMKVRTLNIIETTRKANTNSLNEVQRRKNLQPQQVFQFDLHSRLYNSKNGVVQPEELTNDSRTFHTIGNENSGGRDSLMKKLFHVLNNQIAQQKEHQAQQQALAEKGKAVISAADSLARNSAQRLKVILVNGVTGVGKSNFCNSICKELCAQYPDTTQRKFHLRLRANTKFSLTTTEAMQYVVQTWHVGPLPIHDKQLRELYQQSFIGVTTVLYLEDPSNIHQILSLLPNIKYSPSSRAFVVISSRSQLKLDFDRFSKGYIDLVTDSGVKQVRDRIVELETGNTEGSIAADQHDLDNFSDHESDFETDDESSGESDEEEKPTKAGKSDKYHIKKTPQQKKMEKELKSIFGSAKKKTFAIHIGIKDDDEKIPVFQRHFDVIYCTLEPLSFDGGAEMMQYLNPQLQSDETRSVSALAENLPIFIKVLTRSQMLYGGELSEYSFAIGSFMDKYGNTDFPQLRKLCQGFFIGICEKWEKPLRDFALKLSIFPFSFDAVSAGLILETPLNQTLRYLQYLTFFGLVVQCEPGRFSMHDLVRDTFQIYKDEELSDRDPLKSQIADCEERYVQHYFNLLRLYNMQHEYSGIIYMPGPERYDMDIENMKYVVEFLKDLGNTDYVDALNTGRYIFRNCIYAIDRGRLYTFLESSAAVDKLPDDFGKANFYEGFAMIYFDLMDHKNAYIKAKKALDLLENACILSDVPSDELKQLPVLLLAGEIAFRQNQQDIALRFFEKMVTIATKYAHDWQKITVEKSSDPFAIVQGYEENEVIVKDIFIGKSYICQAKIYMQRGDVKNGKKYFERGLTIMQRIYHRYHPFISDAFASYAQLLRDFKSSQYYEDICKYYKDAIEIDSKIFGEDSFSVCEKLDGYAVALLMQNNYEGAEPIFQKTLATRKRFFGEHDITVSSTHNNLAVCLKHLRKADEAKIHYEASLNILSDLFGPNDSRVATIKTNVAKLKLEFSESYEDAEKTFQEALETLKDENINEKGRQMASTLNSLGDASRQRQDYTKALEYYEQAMAVLEEVKKKANSESTEYSEVISESVKILLSMSNLHYDKQEYKQAEELLERGLGIIQKHLGGENHPLYPNYLSLSANTKLNRKDYSGAEECYRKVIDMKLKQKLPPTGIMPTYQSLAVCLDRQGKYPEAIDQYQKVLNILNESFKDDLDKQMSVLKAIASASTKKEPKDFATAEKYFADVEKLIVKKTGSDNNIEYGEIMSDLGACRIQLQKYEDAILNFATCERIFSEFFGDNHDKTITAKENVQNLRTLMQQQNIKQGCPCTLM